jgi:hypothetical protein
MRKKRAKLLVVGQRTELRDGRKFKLLVLEPATRDYLLDVDGLKHFPPPKRLALVESGQRRQHRARSIGASVESGWQPGIRSART